MDFSIRQLYLHRCCENGHPRGLYIKTERRVVKKDIQVDSGVLTIRVLTWVKEEGWFRKSTGTVGLIIEEAKDQD